MSFDSEELTQTRNRNGLKDYNSKEKIEKIIKKRIEEINSEEWNIPDETNLKFYCKEELERILLKLKEI